MVTPPRPIKKQLQISTILDAEETVQAILNSDKQKPSILQEIVALEQMDTMGGVQSELVQTALKKINKQYDQVDDIQNGQDEFSTRIESSIACETSSPVASTDVEIGHEICANEEQLNERGIVKCFTDCLLDWFSPDTIAY